MDPFSISVGILTILGAGGKVGSGLKKIIALKDAPSDLLALDNERKKTLTIVEAVKEMMLHNSGSEQLSPGLSQSLACMEATALELECFIVYDLTKTQGTEPRVDQPRWLRALPKIREFKARLESDKIDLSLNVNISTLISSTIWADTEDVVANVQRFCGLAVVKNIGQFNAQSQRLDVLLRQSSQHQLERQGLLEVAEAQDRESKLESSSKNLTNQLIGDSADFNSKGQSTALEVLEASEESAADIETKSANANTFVQQAPLLVSTKWPNRCDLDCQCTCHQYRHHQSPRCLTQLLGSLFMGYDAAPWFAKPCRDLFCRAGALRISYSYAFPRWLVARVLQLHMKYSQAQGPELILRVMRIRSNDDRPFALIRTYNILDMRDITAEIRKLIELGEASVLDVTTGGGTYLHYAVDTWDMDLMEYLINSGADPFHWDESGISPYMLAWRMMLGFRNFEEASRLPVLRDRSKLTVFNFSELHKAYLGLSGVTFARALDVVDRNSIDLLDNLSQTTLYWAAGDGDESAVAQLLKCGADPNKADVYGWTPLHRAASEGNKGCVKQLLDAKAHVNARTSAGHTALHFAAQRGKSEIIRLLFDRGASPHDVDNFGKTALTDAIYWRQAQSVRVLNHLGGLNLFGKNSRKRTNFEHAAFYSNIDTLHALFPAATGAILNPNQRSSIEEALSIAQWRKSIHEEGGDVPPEFQLNEDPTEWFEVFEELVNQYLYTLNSEDIKEATADEHCTDESRDADEDGGAEEVTTAKDSNNDNGSKDQDVDGSDEEEKWEDTREA